MKPLKTKTDELLENFAIAENELRKHGVTRSRNNPVADLGEIIACDYFTLKRAKSNQHGYDAKDMRGNKYQIKSRRTAQENKTVQLGRLKNLTKLPFDFLIFVVFDENFRLQRIGKARSRVVRAYSKRGRLGLTKIFLDKCIINESRADAEKKTDRSIAKQKQILNRRKQGR